MASKAMFHILYNAIGGGEERDFTKCYGWDNGSGYLSRNMTHISIFYGAIYWKEKQQE